MSRDDLTARVAELEARLTALETRLAMTLEVNELWDGS